MDLVATIDWHNCRSNVQQAAQISKCACEDKTFKIPQTQRNSRNGDMAWWCSGPLLLTDVDGSDILIWNKYSLEELLRPDINTYVDCLNGGSDSCAKPSSQAARDISRQNVDIMQVITKCRNNYLRKQWDEGALVFGLFSQDSWRKSRKAVQPLDLIDQ